MSKQTSVVEIKPSTLSDIETVCLGRPPAPTIAYTVFLDGKPVCVAGILMYDCPEVFSDFAPLHGVDIGHVPKTTIYRYAKILLELLKSHKIQAITTCLEGRSRFLESLGLEVACHSNNKYFYRI